MNAFWLIKTKQKKTRQGYPLIISNLMFLDWSRQVKLKTTTATKNKQKKKTKLILTIKAVVHLSLFTDNIVFYVENDGF